MNTPVRDTFQLRSSWPRFLSPERFVRLDFAITYVFSIPLNIPTPPAPTILIGSILSEPGQRECHTMSSGSDELCPE